MTSAALAIDGGTMSVSGVLDFASVLDIDARGRQWLAGDAPANCVIDLGAVSYSSSVGIALVLGWMRSALQAGRTVTLANVPADMLALARVGGLETLFAGN